MDLTVGQKAYREMAVTEEMVLRYAEITGDYNPLHFDSDFTSRTAIQAANRPGRHYDGAAERAGRDGHAGGGNGLRKPESTEGGRRVSVLRRQEGAPVLLG